MAKPKVIKNDDWWSIWYRSSTEQPGFTVKAIGAWFDRQVERAAEQGRDDPFSGSPELVAHSQFSGNIIANCAANAPDVFTRELYPRFNSMESKVPQARIVAPSDLGKPDDQLRNALARAMISLAKDNPAELDSIVDLEGLSDTRWMASLVLRAWSANPEFYAERIVRFILDNPDERLTTGYDISVGDGDTFAAISRTALAVASPICSRDLFTELESTVLSLAPRWELKARQVGWTEFTLLRALPEGRMAKSTRRRIQELEHRFPNAPERGAPQPLERNRAARFIGSPIPEDAQRRMFDDHWLSAMTEYTEEWSTFRKGQFVGGAIQLSRGLEELVREDPERFVNLVNRMDETYSHIYFEAILKGLSASDDGYLSAIGTLEQVCSVLRRIKCLDIPVSGVSIAWAVRAFAAEALPEDIIEMLCQIALEDPDPISDLDTSSIDQAINSARGASVFTLAQLLFADRSLWEDLQPTIEKVVEDRVLAVRSVAVEALLAVLDTQRTDALACFDKLTKDADPILGTEGVECFMHYAIFRDYSAIRPLLLNMLESSDDRSVRVAARQMTQAALWVEEAKGDEDIVLGLSEEARIGAAETYSAYLSDESVGAECERHLRSLLEDESKVVRAEAGRLWLDLEPDDVAARGSLIGAYTKLMGPEGGANILIYRLEEARVPLPTEVCDLAERAVQIYGSKVASVQYSEGGIASGLSTLMIRLYEETSDPSIKKRMLDTLDEMVRAGFFGIDTELGQQYDR